MLCVCHLLCVTPVGAYWMHRVCMHSNTNSLSIILKPFPPKSFDGGLCIEGALRWNGHTCSKPLKHMNSIPPCSQGDWVECEHGRNLILQAVPLCLSRPLETCWMELVPREKKWGEERKGEGQAESSKEKYLEGLPDGTCLYIARVHYILHSTCINSSTH